jgi:hypothetical protein
MAKKRINGMTVAELHKRLEKLLLLGHGRLKVYVDIESYSEPLRLSHQPLQGLGLKTLYVADGDGAVVENKNGTERVMNCVSLAGGAGANCFGELVETTR